MVQILSLGGRLSALKEKDREIKRQPERERKRECDDEWKRDGGTQAQLFMHHLLWLLLPATMTVT